MSRIVIPKEMLEIMVQGLKDQVEFVNESGEVLGEFTPAGTDWMFEDPIPPLEELERRVREEKGRPLADIMRDLEKLAS